MALFAISDLHLSFGMNKAMDIFDGWKNYVDRLQENWHNLIKPADTVVIPGDISWGMNLEEAIENFDFLNKLPGNKILIRGNHDYWWNTRTKVENFFIEKDFNTLSIILNNAIKVEGISICGTRGWVFPSDTEADAKILHRETTRLERSIKEGKKLSSECIVFLHYPPVYSNRECEEILNILIEYDIKRCYFGHIHGMNTKDESIIKEYKGIDLNLVTADYLNFCPMKIDCSMP